MINVLFVINHIPCSNQIDGLYRLILKLLPEKHLPAEVVAFQAKKNVILLFAVNGCM